MSGDVHQHTWDLMIAGEDLPDPHGRRIAARWPSAGRWTLRARLDGRPPGELPGVSAGASPAYDLRERPAAVVAIELAAR